MPRTGTTKRYPGLSKTISLHTFRNGIRVTTRLTAGKQAERMQKINEKRSAEISALPKAEQDLVNQMLRDHGIDVTPDFTGPRTSVGQENGVSDDDESDAEGPSDLSKNMQCLPGYRSRDTRVRTDRVELRTKGWMTQLPRLVDAYLDYRARDSGDGLPQVDSQREHAGSIENIELVDMFSRRTTTLFGYNHIYPNEVLIYHGYIGCSPYFPSVAFSIRTLSAFRQMHRTCPRFSIQAQCKILCHLHNVPYRPYLTTQFSIAFDVYLEIMQKVDERSRQVPSANTFQQMDTTPCSIPSGHHVVQTSDGK